MASRRLKELGERNERESADDGSVETAAAAEDQHQQNVSRLVPRHELRVDEPELKRRQVAGEAGKDSSECETRELVAVHRKAERAHPLLVAADSHQGAAERRA